MSKPKLLVCRGSHCRKRLAKHPGIAKAIEALPVEVERVGCQKVCRGPVVGYAVEGKWQWFERVDSKKALHALADLVTDDTISKPLRKRRQAKRAGRVRG